MQHTTTPQKETSEHVSGPGNGVIPMVLVLALTVATIGGIWGLHKKFYIHPIDPIQPVTSAPAAH